MRHKKLKIFAFIVLIVLIGLLFIGNCKKVRALIGDYVSIGTGSSNSYNHKTMLLNVPLAYITPGYYNHFYSTYSENNTKIYIYFGESTIKVSGQWTLSGYNTTIDYTNYETDYYYYDEVEQQITNTHPNNLILSITFTQQNNNSGGDVYICLIGYDSTRNQFMRIHDNNNVPIVLYGSKTQSYPRTITHKVYTDTSTSPANQLGLYDYLYGFEDEYLTYQTIYANEIISHLNTSRIEVAFYQWGVRAIAGNYYDEGYAMGRQAGLEEGYDIGYDDGYDLGYDLGYSTGYDEGESGETVFAPAFRIISDIFGAIGAIMAVELVPHVPLGLFILVPLFFSTLGLILWIWRRN